MPRTPPALLIPLVLFSTGFPAVFTYSAVQASIYPAQQVSVFVPVQSPAQQTISANGTSATASLTSSPP